jgi:hypothetical protein
MLYMFWRKTRVYKKPLPDKLAFKLLAEVTPVALQVDETKELK